jgi:hypothetical protein
MGIAADSGRKISSGWLGEQSCPMQIAISIFDVECEVHDNRRN